jgi:hypothetical protein
MKTIDIRQKLEKIGVDMGSICLGDFDQMGEFTAKRNRSPGDENYASVGAFYRSNYERGILIYYLIRKFNLTSMLEVGFGRGYSSMCAAKAFYDSGIDGRILTVDPNLPGSLDQLRQIFPPQLMKSIHPICGTSQATLSSINEKFDLVYIDGDHSYEATKYDWNATKDKFNSFLLFDDYHMQSKNDPGIKCNRLIDEINESDVDCDEKELIIMDRRIFFDDRRIPDEKIDYGQVLLTKKSVNNDDW